MLSAEKMRRLREERGLSQMEAAKLADVSPQRWNNLERGRSLGPSGVTTATLQKIAKALGVSVAELLK